MDGLIHLKKISLYQLVCLVILTQVGAHVLSIPYQEAQHSGYDSWISILIGGIIAQVVILIIYQLGKRYPNQPLPQYMFTITGKRFGSVLNFLFAVYCLESSLVVVISYSDVINRWVLFETPWFVLIGISMVIAAYIASSTLRSIATITQLILIMFLVCFLILVVSGMGNGDIRHFLPIGAHGLGPIIQDTLPAFWAYAGYELLLYVFPFVQFRKKRDILVAMSVANGFTTLFYMIISIIVLYNYTENQLKLIPEPLVFILRKFRWPIVQSLDILFMSFWFAVTTVTVYVYLYLSTRYLVFIRGQEIHKHPIIVWILAIIGFAIGIWFSDKQLMFQLFNFHNKFTIITIAVIPTLLLFISLVRGKAVDR